MVGSKDEVWTAVGFLEGSPGVGRRRAQTRECGGSFVTTVKAPEVQAFTKRPSCKYRITHA